MRGAVVVAVLLGMLAATSAAARSPGDPIRLAWQEGDVGGTTTVYDGAADPAARRPIGVVEYHQRREGDVLTTRRLLRFRDGSSDEDVAVARVGSVLTALSGRSIVRDTDGQALADVQIDVAGGRLDATWGRGADRRTATKEMALPAGTYWGPLIFIVLKNFDANAEDGRLVFHTVAPTPQPIAIDMELVRGDARPLDKAGVSLTAREFLLRPTVHWTIDPVVHWLAPDAHFWVQAGEPPALVRFVGPRNYARQRIVIE